MIEDTAYIKTQMLYLNGHEIQQKCPYSLKLVVSIQTLTPKHMTLSVQLYHSRWFGHFTYVEHLNKKEKKQ